jgi:hypothetical protein
MSNLELATLERLEAIHEIRMLKHRYMTYCDMGYPPQKIGPLFVDEGVWTCPTLGHCEGRRAIESFFSGTKDIVSFAAHLALNGIIDVDGDTAFGRWRLLMPCTMVAGGKAEARWMLGDYNETYTRRDGKWYFLRLEFYENFNVPASQSWIGLESISPFALNPLPARAA